MSLSIDQVKWINRMGGVALPLPAKGAAGGEADADDRLAELNDEFLAKREAEAAADLDRRDYLIAQSAAVVDKHREEIRKAFDFEVQIGNRVTGSTESMRDDKTGNQEKEVDTRDVTKRAQKGAKVKTMRDGKEDIALLSEATRAYAIIVAEQKRLEGATTSRSVLNASALTIEVEVVQLFDTKSIQDEFFTPLVRARIIPDNVIDGKFSATQSMISATNKIYIDEELKDGKNHASQLSSIGATFANIGGSVANLVTEQLGVDTTMVQGLIGAGVDLVTIGLTATAMGLGFEEADVSALCGKIPAAVGSMVGAVTGMPEVGKAVTAGGSAATSIGSAWIGRMRGKPVTASDITTLVKSCVLDMLSVAGGADGASPEVAKVTLLLTDAVSALDATKVAGIVGGLKKGNWKQVSGGVLSMLSDLAAAAPQLAADGAAVGGRTIGGDTASGLKATGAVVAAGTMLLSDTITAKSANDVAASLEKNLPGILGQVVASATGSAEAGTIAKEGSAAFGQIGVLLTLKATGKAVAPKDLATAMTAAITAVFDDVALAPGGSKAEVGVAKAELLKVAAAFGSSGDAATLLGNGPVADKKKAVAKLLVQMLLAAPGAAGAATAAAPGGGSEAEKAAAGLAQTQALLDTVTEQVEGARAKLAGAAADVAKIQKDLDDGYAKKAEAESEGLLDAFEKQRTEYEASIKAALQPGGDEKLIMTMIADMKRQQAILSVAITVGSAGAEIAAQFFSPLAIGKELLVMIANIAIAVQRARDLKKMLDARQWAESAVSVYRSSIDNFVKNQAEQLTEHSIKAAMNALRIAAEVAATAYPKAKVVATAVSIAQAGVNASFALYQEADLIWAWSVTKDALADLEDRKLGLKARRVNATLAKYCIAYGATEQKDPVAVKTMNEVGLTTDMLQSEGAGVTLVKRFLEARFPEDAVVGGSWNPTAEWLKTMPAPKLETVSLFGCYKRMAAAGTAYFDTVPAALGTPSNAAVGAMNGFAAASKVFAAASKATAPLLEPGKAKGAAQPARQALLDALVKETAAGTEARRLLGAFQASMTASAEALKALKDAKRFATFQAEAQMLVLQYRSLAQDELDKLEMDLLTPLLERKRLEALLAAPPVEQQAA